MGQKTHPYGFRVGVIKTWSSKWYEDGAAYQKWLHQDIRIKRAIKQYLYNANIAGVEIERAANLAKGETPFPGVSSFTDNEVFIDVQEVRKAETNAQLVAENIATQLERRIAFRR